MSSTSSRTSSRGNPQRPSTPDQTGRTLERTASYAVAPKSEYLRNALQARRAHHTPTSSLQTTQPTPPPASKPAGVKTPRRSPDVFAEFALSEEQQTPVSPIRRRRTSDVAMGIPRSRTTRELQNELDKLKEKLMTSNLRVELLKSSNSELQQNLASAKEQIERLEPLEDENYDLRAENNQLKLKVENMDDEIAKLKDINEDHRKTNEELTAIASESAAHWEAHEFAIEEAAECIIKMEEEKAVLTKELQELKERVIALESSTSSTLVDGPAKYPSRVYSVDESRPSTSHFDSDYYSQPSSPQAKPSSESVTSFTPSELSRKFLDLKEERRRSTRELVNRMSAVSLRALREASPSPAPEIPQIPEAYQQPSPKTVHNDRSETPRANPVRYRKDFEALAPSLVEAAQISSPVRPHTVAPQAPAPQPDGLRGLYRPERRSSNRASTDVRPSSMVVTGSANMSSFGNRHQYAEPSPHSLSRSSSNHTGTNSSNERLQRTLRHRKSSASMRTAASSEWEILASNHSPPVSVSSQADPTTEVDPREDKDRWWRSIDRLTLSQVNAQSHQHLYSGQLSNTPPDIDHSRNLDPINTSRGSVKTNPRKCKSAVSSNTQMTYEKDFLFNPAESEEDFMRKARNAMPKRKP